MSNLIDLAAYRQRKRPDPLQGLPEMGPDHDTVTEAPWTVEDYNQHFQAMRALLQRAFDALTYWEEWEARWIQDPAAWSDGDNLPKLTQDLFDELISVLQPLRNHALYYKQGE